MAYKYTNTDPQGSIAGKLSSKNDELKYYWPRITHFISSLPVKSQEKVWDIIITGVFAGKESTILSSLRKFGRGDDHLSLTVPLGMLLKSYPEGIKMKILEKMSR